VVSFFFVQLVLHSTLGKRLETAPSTTYGSHFDNLFESQEEFVRMSMGVSPVSDRKRWDITAISSVVSYVPKRTGVVRDCEE
jgi:hypothetical protein